MHPYPCLMPSAHQRSIKNSNRVNGNVRIIEVFSRIKDKLKFIHSFSIIYFDILF